MERFEVIDT